MSDAPKVPTDEDLLDCIDFGHCGVNGWGGGELVRAMAEELLGRRQEVIKLKRALQWFFDNDTRFSLLTSKPAWITEDEVRQKEILPAMSDWAFSMAKHFQESAERILNLVGADDEEPATLKLPREVLITQEEYYRIRLKEFCDKHSRETWKGTDTAFRAGAKSRLLHGGPCKYKRSDFQAAWSRGWFAVDRDLLKTIKPVFEMQYGEGPSSAPPSSTAEQPLGLLDESPNEATPGELPAEDVPGRG